MSVRVNKSEKFVEVVIENNSLEKEVATELRDTVLALLEEGHSNFELNFAKTEYADSSGIGKLLFLQKKLESANKKLKISKISPRFYEFLDSLTITKVIETASPSVK